MLHWSEYVANWPDLEYPNFISLMDDLDKKWGAKTAIFFVPPNSPVLPAGPTIFLPPNAAGQPGDC